MDYYNEIKEQIINNELTRKVKDYSKNRSDLSTYYNVGKLLSDAGKHYGDGIIKEYSKKLTLEFGKGYSQRNLRNMRQFYKVTIELKWQTVSAKLSWSHYCELLWLDEEQIIYYIKICEEQNLDVRALRNKIKSNEYGRLEIITRNKLISKKQTDVIDFIKNPILIKNSYNYEIISEKLLQKLILEDIPSFLDELGDGFTFIRNEFKIKLGDRYNYIDLLLYNIKYKCYVVVELKISELKKEHIGQIQFYMNYVDKKIRTIDENKTVGLIICRKNNSFIIEYCSDDRIITKEYELV